MKITAHCVVKNEEDFIWYAVASVIDFVDEIMVWDNGSTDKTKSIIRSISNSKIKFAEMSGPVEIVRQKMIDRTDSDWIFILDGDEVWSEEAIENCKLKMNNPPRGENSRCDVIAAPNYMLIGDIFHYQESSAGRYKIAGKVGHYNIRAVRVTPGLHVDGVYPNEAYVNENGIEVQNLPEEKTVFLEAPYLHASFLKKLKYEFGIPFPKDFYYPEVFFRSRPDIVPSPWKTIDLKYKLNALWQTPLKKIKRKII